MDRYSIRHDKVEKRQGYFFDGKFAIGIVAGIALCSILFVAIDFFSVAPSFLPSSEQFPIIVSLLVSVTSIGLAARALHEQKRQREASTDPVLIAHLGQREDARAMVTFNVSNVGAGAALNVVLDVQLPPGGVEGRELITDVFHRHHPFTVILQDNSVEFSLAIGWHLLGTDPLPPFNATLSYEDLSGGLYESEFVIDVRQLEGLAANESPQMQLVKALESIAKKLNK